MIKGSKGIIDACLHVIRCIPFDPHIIIQNNSIIPRGSNIFDIWTSNTYYISNCKLLSQRKWRKHRASGSAHALPRLRIAKLHRDCRIMPKKNRNARPWTAGQGVMRHGRRIKAGFVKHRTTPRHNSYSLLAAQRSRRGSACALHGCPALTPRPPNKKEEKFNI